MGVQQSVHAALCTGYTTGLRGATPAMSQSRFADTISEEKLMKHIDHVNNDEDVDGFIVQLPLPPHISVEKITEKIRADKDVDGFTNQNFGSIISKTPLLMPATPFGLMELLRRYNIETEGSHAVRVGASRVT